MSHNFVFPHDKGRFFKINHGESKEYPRREKPDDVHVIVSEAHESTDFLSRIVAERNKLNDSGAHLIHVNPKFLNSNMQGQCIRGESKQSVRAESRPCFHHISRGVLHGKPQGQNQNVAVSQPQIAEDKISLCTVNSVNGSRKRPSATQTSSSRINNILVHPRNSVVVTKRDSNKNVNLACKNLQSRSVHINPYFTPVRPVPVEALRVETRLQENHATKLVGSSEETKMVHFNPRFHYSRVRSESFKLDNLNHLKTTAAGNLQAGRANVTLGQSTKKCVYVNPKFAMLKKSDKQSCRDERVIDREKIGLLVKKTADGRVLHLPNAKPDISDPLPISVQLQEHTKGADFSSDGGEKRDAKLSVAPRAQSFGVVAPASRNPGTSSLVVLSKTKLIRRSTKGAAKSTCEEQRTVFVSNSSRKLVKRRRTLSSGSRLARSVEQPAPRPSPLAVPARPLRTKYKLVRNVAAPINQTSASSGPGSLVPPSSKLEKRSSVCDVAGKDFSLRKNARRSSLVLLSRTKLIRQSTKSPRNRQTVTISNNARKLVRRRRSSANVTPRPNSATPGHVGSVKLTHRSVAVPAAVRLARSLRTKYKYIRNLSDQKGRQVPQAPHPGTRSRFVPRPRYGGDWRTARRPRRNYRGYGRSQWRGQVRVCSQPYPRRVAPLRLPARRPGQASLVWRNANYVQARRVARSNRRLGQVGRPRGGALKCRAGTPNMVRIGGVLYRRTLNKLTRTNSGGVGADACATSLRGRVVHIRGSKFLMEASGKTMRRLEPPRGPGAGAGGRRGSPPVMRVDIGGVTFLQTSRNVLIRTDYHRARSILSQAKQRSIATLTQKLKKNNQPCVFYQRFGRCPGKDSGACPRVHDPKRIALCRRFLQGRCELAGCPLSHDVVPEKMATCRFFLEGVCVRDNCPYLHVKLSSKAGVCVGFLQGYCPLGDKCERRHVNVCPELDRAGKCTRGKSCPYPHKVGARPRAKRRSEAPSGGGGGGETRAPPIRAPAPRYYEGSGPEAPPLGDPPVAKRSRLGPMPGYIAFK
ncbi:zinc finger CCCH domain-containing protein 3 [Bacillus rossius redtenbacheri]|uniref:zinc finger CCCH domain-containing protein 3 n=1 Tax=Bacillus rossius redtenbacheri TaxID=93214 RepID=UPI002FDC9A62